MMEAEGFFTDITAKILEYHLLFFVMHKKSIFKSDLQPLHSSSTTI